MNIFRYFKNKGLSNKGTSILELTLVAGIMSFVALGTTFTIQQNLSESKKAERRVGFADTSSQLQTALSHQTSATGSCVNLVTIPPGTNFNPNGQTDIELNLFGETFQAGYVSLDGSYRVEELYTDNVQLLGVNGSDTTYTASIFMISSIRQNNANMNAVDPNDRGWARLPLQRLTSISVKFNAAGAMIDCNLEELSITSEAVCETVQGMFWSEADGACYEIIELDNDRFRDCPALRRLSNGECIPENTDCVFQQLLPQGFEDGSLTDCNSLPPTHSVVHENPSLVPVPTAAALPPPKCTCGRSGDINQGQLCVACEQVNNSHGFLGLESYYYYTVFECVINPAPANGNSGELDQIMGPFRNGTFRDGSDPPSGFGCTYHRKEGIYNSSSGKYYQYD